MAAEITHDAGSILIIEDEPAIADNVVYALETEGFRTRWVRLGGEGLEALAGQLRGFAQREQSLLRQALAELRRIDPVRASDPGAVRFLEIDLSRRVGELETARKALRSVPAALLRSERWQAHFSWLAKLLGS